MEVAMREASEQYVRNEKEIPVDVGRNHRYILFELICQETTQRVGSLCRISRAAPIMAHEGFGGDMARA